MVDGDDERRLGCVTSCQVQAGIGVGNEPSDDDDTSDVEQQDTDVDTTNGFREISARILGFTGCDLRQE